MEAAGLVRAARRAAGEGQASFGARAGVSARTLSALETGSSDPRWSTVVSLLAAGGLELTAVPASPPPTAALLDHLHRSTSYRLRWSLNRPRAWGNARLWQELGALTAYGQVRLEGRQAVGVWLPVSIGRGTLPVVLHPADRVLVEDSFPGLAIRLDDGPVPPAQVPVAVGPGALLLPAPLALAAHPDCGALAQELRLAAGLLDDDRSRDFGGRRAPAHRDPRESVEFDRVLHRRRLRGYQLPSAADSRAWRLRGSASLATWLQSHPQR